MRCNLHTSFGKRQHTQEMGCYSLRYAVANRGDSTQPGRPALIALALRGGGQAACASRSSTVRETLVNRGNSEQDGAEIVEAQR